MSINNDLKNLYESWKRPGLQFVSGGVVDEAAFNSSNPKIMMLLKEVNDPDGNEDWSLVDLLQKQIESDNFLSTWRNVGMWSYGAQNSYNEYNDIKINYENMNIAYGLQCIATTNLKKNGGSGESDMAQVRAHAIDQKELWTKEIEIINPDIIICGGTFSIVQEILKFEVSKCGSGARIGRALDTLFIEFYHPQYRISPKVLYAYFKETMISLGFS